jgi:hypothetical protein
MSSRRPVRARSSGSKKDDVLDWNHIELESESSGDERASKRSRVVKNGEEVRAFPQSTFIDVQAALMVTTSWRAFLGGGGRAFVRVSLVLLSDIVNPPSNQAIGTLSRYKLVVG